MSLWKKKNGAVLFLPVVRKSSEKVAWKETMTASSKDKTVGGTRQSEEDLLMPKGRVGGLYREKEGSCSRSSPSSRLKFYFETGKEPVVEPLHKLFKKGVPKEKGGRPVRICQKTWREQIRGADQKS